MSEPLRPLVDDPNTPAMVADHLIAVRDLPVELDLEAGLARHAALVKAGAPTPAWARSIVGLGRAAVLWLVGGAAVVATATTVALSDGEPEPVVVAEREVAQAEPPAATLPPSPAPSPAVPRPVSDPTQTPSPAQQIRSGQRAPRTEKPATGRRPTAAPAPRPAPPIEADAPAATGPKPAQDLVQLEVRETARARRWVGSDPVRALQVLRALDTEVPGGFFAEERQALTVLALIGAGDPKGARRANEFLKRHPGGPFSARVRRALASLDAKSNAGHGEARSKQAGGTPK